MGVCIAIESPEGDADPEVPIGGAVVKLFSVGNKMP
jgi:hypothetical protein